MKKKFLLKVLIVGLFLLPIGLICVLWGNKWFGFRFQTNKNSSADQIEKNIFGGLGNIKSSIYII